MSLDQQEAAKPEHDIYARWETVIDTGATTNYVFFYYFGSGVWQLATIPIIY